MGDLAVGNADGPEGTRPSARATRSSTTSRQNTFLTDIVYPGSTTTTAYGIWYNGGTSYTIAAATASSCSPSSTIGNGYLVDYDSATGQFTNWTSFAYPNGLVGQDYVTHFQGISSTEQGVYTLGADSAQTGSSTVRAGLAG